MPARILIVDDMLPSLKVLAAKLAAEYYDVLTAADGPTALGALGEQKPDLILLDIMMPGMDGFEVCRRIKNNSETAHLPVVMVTALSDHADRIRGLEAGADDFLTKPVDDNLLFARVRSQVRLKRMLDQWRLREETTLKLGFPPSDNTFASDDAGKARIALFDDSPIESANIQQVLSQDLDQVTVIGSAKNAANELAKVDADVVAVSISGEGENALRLCSQLRSLEHIRQVPILLIGGEEDMNHLLKALELGVNDFILRPLDEQELLARIRTQVRRKRYHDCLQDNFLHNLSLTLTDSLTNLHNRRYLKTHLGTVMREMAQTGQPLSLLMIDIDRFKQINDAHGHALGDKALCEVAQRISHNIRGFDLAARYGGEEFAVVMPDTTINVAIAVAERLRGGIADQPVAKADSGEDVFVTVSIGVAETVNVDASPESLLKSADTALYQAKNEGRNRVIPGPREGVKVPWEAGLG